MAAIVPRALVAPDPDRPQVLAAFSAAEAHVDAVGGRTAGHQPQPPAWRLLPGQAGHPSCLVGS